MEHYVYMVRCADNTIYTGYATNVEKRVAKHNTGKGARYTSGRIPVVLLAYWRFETKSEALKEEYRIKQLNSNHKLRMAQAFQEKGKRKKPKRT